MSLIGKKVVIDTTKEDEPSSTAIVEIIDKIPVAEQGAATEYYMVRFKDNSLMPVHPIRVTGIVPWYEFWK